MIFFRTRWGTEEPYAVDARHPTGHEWRTFWANPLARWGVIGLLGTVVFCFGGPLFWHLSATAPRLSAVLSPPSIAHPLGTDALGRDELARLMVGGQLSLTVGFAAALTATAFGVFYGLISGLVGGAVDSLLMRIVDVLYAIPALFVLLFLDSVFKPRVLSLIVVIAALSWFATARLVRSEVLSLKQRGYIEAARAIGAGPVRLMGRHLLPNVIATVITNVTFQVADAILTVAALSFLGLGLPPSTPNWGQMLASGTQYLFENAWWLIYPPGLAILVVELSVTLIGDALRQRLDSRLSRPRL